MEDAQQQGAKTANPKSPRGLTSRPPPVTNLREPRPWELLAPSPTADHFNPNEETHAMDQSPERIELIEPAIAPFTDQVKTLLLDSVGKIADQWIEQLNIIRDNANALEKQILECVGRTKHDIEVLHELGHKIAAEAKRGQEVCLELIKGVEKIS